MRTMRRGLVWIMAALLAGPALALEPGTIVIERPTFNSAREPNTNNYAAYRVWQQVGARYACWRVFSNYDAVWWPALVNGGLTLGPVKDCTVAISGSPEISFPGTAWTGPTTALGFTLRSTGTAGRILRYTAGRDYAYVAVRCQYAANDGDLSIALTPGGGSAAELLTATVDASTGASSFKHSYAGMMADRFVTIARNLQAGDVLDFTTSAQGKYIRLCAILGITVNDATPTSADALHVCPSLLVDGSAGLDPRVLVVRPIDENPGDAPLISIDADGQTTRYWASPEHGNSDNTLTGAGGAGMPTITMMYYDATYPQGTTWSPAVGERRTVQALRIETSGEAKMFGSQVGGYKQVQWYDARTATLWWEVHFNVDPPAGLVLTDNGYAAAMKFNDHNGWVLAPGALAPTKLVVDNENQDAGPWYGNTCYLYGGTLGDAVIRFSGQLSYAGADLFVEQKNTGGNKVYYRGRLPASRAVVNGDRISGGYEISLTASEDLRPTLPRGYRR